MSLLRTATLLALVVALAGCAPLAPTPAPTVADAPKPKPTVSATPTTAPEAPVTVNAADFLLDGTPGTFDADGFWKGHYGFYTDESKAVRCDVWIFSGDSGGVTCAITPGNEGLVTYALPVADCQPADGNGTDGYSIGINFKVFPASNTGFTGCGTGTSDFAASTPVLNDDQTLYIEHESERFTCTTVAGVATCADASSGASIRFGTSVAQFQG